MKGLNFYFTITLFLAMVLFPLFAIESEPTEKPQKNQESSETQKTENETFLVYFPDSDKVEEMSARDYVIGVLAGEMPLSYEDEALKAQAVAAYTYAVYKKNGTKSDATYHLSASHTSDQEYLTIEQMKERYGDEFDTYYNKAAAAVDAVLGELIVYDGKPIFAAYHSISSGKTELACNVWDSDVDYLVSVESTGDIMSKDYLSEVKVSEEDFKTAMEELGAKITKGENAVGEIKRSESGSVLEIEIGGKTLSGTQVRSAFSLRSANFDPNYSDGTYTFTVRGYGHNVGMSQFGAQFMALQGSNYIEILSWYYPECSLQK